MRCHHDDDTVGRDVADGLEELEPIQARHADVGQHDIDVLAADEISRDHAVFGHEHVEALPLKQDAHPFAHRLLVVHNQDARGVATDSGRWFAKGRRLGPGDAHEMKCADS